MRWIYLGVSALCLFAWISFGSYAGPLGMPIPPLGELVSPATGFWRNASPALTQPPQGQLSHASAYAEGSVYYDERGVPHIFAPNLKAAVYLQGYVTARDRLWQMDISNRSTGGELSEVLGESIRARDIRQIRHGYRTAGKEAVEVMKTKFPEDYALVEVYAEGVNAFIAQLEPADYPIEFKIMDYAPRMWAPFHSMMILKGMSQSMTDRSNDLRLNKTKVALGDELFTELFPANNPKQTPIIPSGTVFEHPAAKPRQAPALLTARPAFSPALSAEPTPSVSSANEDEFPFAYHPTNGSNNWAISGSKSNTGLPILAGDPHLGLSLPSIWYEIQIHTPELNCRGVSLPGLPLIVIGFNEHIAWSMTNGGVDVTDWYQPKWLDEDYQTYQLDSGLQTIRLVQDTLQIKGAPSELITTHWTEWGPVTELSDTSSMYFGLAKQHQGLYFPVDRPTTEIGTMQQMMAARNYDDFQVAMEGYADPIMNFAFATNSGDISILSNGYYPLRSKKDEGRLIREGDSNDDNWQGYIPFPHLPQSNNPRRGFVSSANQQQTDLTYPYFYQGNYPAWRGRYINRRLAQLPTGGQRDMKNLQLDAHSIYAEELAPLLLARINRDQLTTEGRRYFQLLAEWDYQFSANSKAATLFERWRKKVYALTIDETDWEEDYSTLPSWRWIELLRRQPEHPIFDIQETKNRETAAILTQRAWDELLEEGEALVPWHEARNTAIRHLGRIPGFGVENIITDGHFSAPNAITGTHGPSWRMVVELGAKPRAWGVLPGGPSGNPASAHYAAGVEEWSKGRYFELAFWLTADEAEKKASARLHFTK